MALYMDACFVSFCSPTLIKAFLGTFTTKDVYNYWIGINNLDGDGSFTWINNTQSGFVNLTPSPDGSRGRCVRFISTTSASNHGKWAESSCLNERVHICQRPIDPRCSWQQFGQSFYRFMGNGRNFDGAKTECMNNGGRLAIIRSAELNNFLTSIISPDLLTPYCYWFGLKQDGNGDPFTWTDNTQISTSFWAPGNPNINGQNCACLWSDGNNATIHGRWDGMTCSRVQPYICERPQVPNREWTYIPDVQDVRYYSPSISLNYFNAREYCQHIGGKLGQLKISAISMRTQSWIRSQFTDLRFWFGLDDLGSEGDYRWADGTLLRHTSIFTRWSHSNNPDNYQGNEHCIESDRNGWNDRFCSASARFICEKSEAPPLHLLAMTPTPFGSTGATSRYSCILSTPHNTQSFLNYTERAVVQSLTTEGFTLAVSGTIASHPGGFTKNLPSDDTSVGVYKCASTSTSTGTSTSADVTILSTNRHFQPTDGRLTQTIYPGDDITLSVTKMDNYTANDDQIRWSTFSNLAEGSLSLDGDGSLMYTIRSASGRDANVYGTYQDGLVESLVYSLIRVIVSECPRGRWDVPACDRLCDNCYNGGICHPQSGTCLCAPGFMGRNCLTACSENRFGWECELQCGAGNVLEACNGSQICLPDPYGCNCLAGYTGVYCDEQCPTGTFGVDCLQDCHCADGISCDAFTGRCDGECENGWSGEGCQVPSVCSDGYFGINCTDSCNCPDHSACGKDSGFCTSSEGQCEIGYIADSPEMPDRCGTFSGCFESCSKTCHCGGGAADCNQETGMCSGSCHPRWMGDPCQEDRFVIEREKTNPGIAKFSCSFASVSTASLSSHYVRAALGDLSSENWQMATTVTIAQSLIQSNFTISDGVNLNQPIYCFVGNSTSDNAFAFVRLPSSDTFVLPVFSNAPRIADLGYTSVIIVWDSWSADFDEGEGPISGYRVYVTTPDGNETHTSPVLSAVGPLETVSSRKKRQGDEGDGIYNVTGLAEGETYEIRIAVVRDGLNGEGEKGPALSVMTLETTPPPPTSSSLGGMIGGAVGGIIVILLIIVVIIIVLRKRRLDDRKPRNGVSKPVEYTMGNDYINGVSTENETGPSVKPKPNPKPRPVVVSKRSTTMPEDLPQSQDGLDEPDVLSSSMQQPLPRERGPIPLSQFPTLVQKNRHTTVFQDEFLALPEANIYPQTVAEKKINFEKNRYKNILPYDSSRVKLAIINDDPDSDYFNASYIPSFRNDRAYIASQGPNKASMDDFWRMIWQENVKTIAMITKLQEGPKIKCRQYWPESTPMTFGDIAVELESVVRCTEGLKRTMFLKRGKDTRRVNQFHFTEWPDKKVPKNTSSLLKFISEVQKDHGRNDSPLLVHCSAGVGRTGVVLSIDSVVAEAKKTEKVDIFGYASKMRQHRPFMVQTKEQYEFVYLAVLEALLSGDTGIPACYFTSTLAKLKEGTRSIKGKRTELTQQFENLKIICPDPPTSMIRTGTMTENRSKSRYGNSVPMERNRVILQSEISSDSDFINASFVTGARCKFITTQMPMPNTVTEFWAMIIDYKPTTIVMLNNGNKRDKSCAQYWLDTGVTTFGDLSVTTLSVSDRNGFIEREIAVTRNSSKKGRHVVKQYQFHHWPTRVKEQKESAPHLLNLLKEVEDSVRRDKEGFPVLVHCLNGVGRTGVFCSMLECIAQINEENTVDVFQTVNMLRNERMHFVKTEEEYAFIYELINEYLKVNDYEQLPVPANEDDHTYGNVESASGPATAGDSVYEITEFQDGANVRASSYGNVAERRNTSSAEGKGDAVYENVNYEQ